jgi:hypothetical protein
MDVFIPIVFADYKIAAMGTKWRNLGHAGILFILGKSGTAKYYEYGRYDQAGLGLVRKVFDSGREGQQGRQPGPQLAQAGAEIDLHAVRPRHANLGAYIEQAGMRRRYVEGRKKRNTDRSRQAYGLTDNNCGTFMQATLDAAGVNTPWMVDPRPNSNIEELRDDFRDLDYDPTSNVLTIASAA